MSPYVLGQRFVSEAEPELGLGRVERIEKRSLVLPFAASDTLRRLDRLRLIWLGLPPSRP